MWDFQENGLQLKSSSSDRVDLDYSSFQLHCFIFSFYCHHLKESLFIEMSECHRLFLNFKCNRETPVCHRREGCIRHLNVECLLLRCFFFTPRPFHSANMHVIEGKLLRDLFNTLKSQPLFQPVVFTLNLHKGKYPSVKKRIQNRPTLNV